MNYNTDYIDALFKDEFLTFIVGAARPDEVFLANPIYYFYREKVKEINTNTNLISFLTNLYHYFKETSK